MRLIGVLALAAPAGVVGRSVACNGAGGGGGSSAALSSGRAGLSAGIALGMNAPLASVASASRQQAMVRQLAFQRFLQEQYQQQLAAQQQMMQDQTNQQ